jgi:hypothetical protein
LCAIANERRAHAAASDGRSARITTWDIARIELDIAALEDERARSKAHRAQLEQRLAAHDREVARLGEPPADRAMAELHSGVERARSIAAASLSRADARVTVARAESASPAIA